MERCARHLPERLAMNEPDWITVEPEMRTPRMRRAILEFVRELGRVDVDRHDRIDGVLDEFLEQAPEWPAKDRQRARTLARVLVDVRRQGWSLRIRKDQIAVRVPTEIAADPAQEKDRVRRQEQL